jgi:hypothetical protein
MSHKKSDDLCDLHERFEDFIKETLDRLLESEKITKIKFFEIQERLVKDKLTGKDVLKDVTDELVRICKIEYEQVEPGSDRLNGYGWSRTKISSHMKRHLQSKLDECISVIQDLMK